jgi:hypothetical protein
MDSVLFLRDLGPKVHLGRYKHFFKARVLWIGSLRLAAVVLDVGYFCPTPIRVKLS